MTRSHSCHRCGTVVNSLDDSAKIELETYEGDGVESKYFYILCKFCSESLQSFLHGDDGSIDEYHQQTVKNWTVSEDAMEKHSDDIEHFSE